MIEIKNLSIEFPQSVGKCLKIIENLSLQIVSGEIFGILGQNGSGKSAILKTLASILPPVSGNIFYHDSAVVSSQVIYLPQETHCMTVRSDMPEKLSLTEKERKLKQQSWVAECDRWALRDIEVHSTSSGERQMIAIAQALLANPGFLFLDEPFMPLDAANRKQVMQWLTAFSQNGAAIVVTSSHPEWLDTLCHRIGILTPGCFTLAETKEKQGQEPNEYHIRIATTLDENRAAWFEGLQIQNNGNQTSLIGKLEDQAALFGVLGKIRDMGIELISVNRIHFNSNTGQDQQLHCPNSRRGGE